MNDVIERLRAENPVPECPPPSLDDVWRKLDARDAEQTVAPRRRPPEWLVVGFGAVPVAAIAVAAVVALRSGSPASPARHGPAGPVIVHYTATTIERVSARKRLTIRREVWLSGPRSHIEYYLGNGLRAELTSTPDRVQEYLGPARGNVIAGGALAKGTAVCSPTLIICGFRAVDPVAFVNELVRTGALQRDGSTVVGGRALELLQSPRGHAVVPGHPGLTLRVLVDPHTSVPVEILAGHAASPGSTRLTIAGYDRLALTGRSEKLLAMSLHPGAAHECRRFCPDNSAGNC